ncbi:beta family protein [Clavibacter sepedonicus]|uniref:Phage-related protein n=1 Tax=Clavibacter sepedonicus TaxID=31964 RepID=B0REZ5_CLASE|nr:MULTISPECIES: beta family protein [Clavibacter]MBD5382993.1 hypothetical protein [Clavibacter sp.]OQJ49289.1 hypothetical protein B5P19_14375 [Clavibacter sepedonicus]OQJ54904.1 hypothetical protein B5P20_12955 [Clavibacter sepedonicus]UUK64866.1 beta family protein [Clavibacter sepedonicus]CAQ00928.1 putative phage-related protein [Clavibacter sepedonicus]
MTYLPVLKARQGELKALENWDDIRRPDLSPVIEVTPWERQEDSTVETRDVEDQPEIDSAVRRIKRAWDQKRAIAYIDAAYAEPDLGDGSENWRTSRPVLAQLLHELSASDVSVAPAIRASADASYVSQIGSVLEATGISRALIRVTAEDLDESIIPLRRLVGDVASGLGLPTSDISVLLDFGAVTDEGPMKLAARLARFVLPQLDEVRWASLSVAAGAFPVNLAGVQAFSSARIPRWDYHLWESLRDFDLAIAGGLQFSDYGVTHPTLPVGAAFAAPPQLRYTQDRDWIVRKGKRQERRGHKQFYDICAQILDELGRDATSPEASWGDHYVHEAAASAIEDVTVPARVGTGNASTWRAVATSHHLAYMVDQLRGRGEL